MSTQCGQKLLTSGKAGVTMWVTFYITRSDESFKKEFAAYRGGGKELIMAMNNTSNRINKSVMGFCYYCYFKACFFAGLFCRAIKPPLSACN